MSDVSIICMFTESTRRALHNQIQAGAYVAGAPAGGVSQELEDSDEDVDDDYFDTRGPDSGEEDGDEVEDDEVDSRAEFRAAEWVRLGKRSRTDDGNNDDDSEQLRKKIAVVTLEKAAQGGLNDVESGVNRLEYSKRSSPSVGEDDASFSD